MGDEVFNELRSRNRTYIIILVLLGVLVTAGLLFTQLPKGETENDSKPDDKDENKQPKKGTQENKTVKTNNTVNQTKNNTKEPEKDLFDFNVKSISDLDESACGAPPAKLFEWFGEPLYATGWEIESGKRGDPNSFKFFVWNKSIIFTKGKYNSSSNKVETFQYMSRENTNNTLEKLIDCDE